MVLARFPYTYPGRTPTTSGQQTFLGASIVNFTQALGYDNDTSTLNVELAVDAANSADQTLHDQGQDIYHNGVGDAFRPPPVGSPVFFAYSQSGHPITHVYHNPQDGFYFGGILQSYRKSNDATRGPRFSARVVDPREVLDNVRLIINDKAEAIASDNLLNVGSFLEHSPTGHFFTMTPRNDIVPDLSGGSDMLGTFTSEISATLKAKADKIRQNFSIGTQNVADVIESLIYYSSTPSPLTYFPITGPGYARRTGGGVPYYRIIQALNTWSGSYGPIYGTSSDVNTHQYRKYFGRILFRGHQYYVDYSELPIIYPLYRFDASSMSMLEFFTEIAEVANGSLFFDLSPYMTIKLRFIKRTQSAQQYNTALSDYIDAIEGETTSTDIGHEMTNIPTQKYLVGANTVNFYYFRDNQRECAPNMRWELGGMLAQQILPFFGFLQGGTVTIPKGFGPYKQILLDATNLTANGVGNFYVATEMELRHAKVSFDSWKNFLLSYNTRYLESCEADDISDNIRASQTQADPNGGAVPIAKEENYRVTVPRCMWGHFTEPVYDANGQNIGPYTYDDGKDGYCSPPYGYPLYFGRANNIGIPEAGLAGMTDKASRMIESINDITAKDNQNEQKMAINSALKKYQEDYVTFYGFTNLGALETGFLTALRNTNQAQAVAALESVRNNAISFLATSKKLAKNGIENAKKIHAFLKNIADECLGKKFLVKIPQACNNAWYKFPIAIESNNLLLDEAYNYGPFGFAPDYGYIYKASNTFISDMLTRTTDLGDNCLKAGYNPFTDLFEYNFEPATDGGFFANTYSNYNLQQFNFFPKDLDPLYNGNGRISSFCRYNHSQYFSFGKLQNGSFTQQVRSPESIAGTSATYYPDIGLNLSNTAQSTLKESYYNNNDARTDGTYLDSQPDTIAFVKCSIDENFYHAPATAYKNLKASTGVTKRTVLDPPSKISIPFNDEDNNIECELKDAVRLSRLHFQPTNASTMINTLRFDFNPLNGFMTKMGPNVYALVTMDGPVEPLANTSKGTLGQPGLLEYMHLLFNDAIPQVELRPELTTLAGTSAIAFPPDLTNVSVRNTYTNFQILSGGLGAREKKAIEGLSLSAEKINLASPSPIQPDYIALALRNLTENYGPWKSEILYSGIIPPGTTNYFDVGGKTEYIKDENIAPWNFNGFDMMDKYARNLVNFEEEPALWIERGSFSIPDVPNSLNRIGTQPTTSGAVITNVSTDVSVEGVVSTYTLSTYTDTFGRIQKQKADQIKKFASDRQKLQDQRNKLIRTQIGKSQSSNSFVENIQNTVARYKVLSSQTRKEDKKVDGYTGTKEVESTSTGGAIMSGDDLNENTSAHAAYPDALNAQLAQSAISDVADEEMPISLEPGNPYLASIDTQQMSNIDYDDGLEGITNNEYNV